MLALRLRGFSVARRPLSSYLSLPDWSLYFSRLAAYRNAKGDCRVPARFASADGTQLGTWVTKQRVAHKQGRLNAEKKGRLEALGFVWDLGFEAWESNFQLFLRYRQEHGDVDVPVHYVAAEKEPLGNWASAQRRAFAAGTLSPHKAERLEACGFAWRNYKKRPQSFANLPASGVWLAHCEDLEAYGKQFGHVDVPADFVTQDGGRLGRWVFEQRNKHLQCRLSQLRFDRLESMAFVWSALAEKWESHYEVLRAFKKEYDSCTVPADFEMDGVDLGTWVSIQRTWYKHNRVTPDRILRLERVGFDWDTLVIDWNAHFDQLAAYRAAEGHSVVPTEFVTADGKKLGSWVSKQRLAHKEGKLSPERIERLEAVGFVWQCIAEWDPYFELLQDYRAEHGHCVMPTRFETADGIKLGYWVQQQRRNYKTGELRPERVLRLERVGFVWDPLACLWDANFEALTAYLAAHGNCAVPQTFAAADGTKLGAWVMRLRQAYKAGELSPERIERLEAVAFMWRVPFRSATLGWDKTLELLQAYCEANGHCAVPDTFVAADGTKLGRWVAAQRSLHKKLSAERVERLEAVEFVWRSPVGLAAAWDAHFELLTAYHAAHGNCVVPSNFVAADGTKLGSWVDRQRTAHHAEKLSAERVERLTAVAFVWTVRADEWDANFELLRAYHAAHGDCALPYLFVAADGTKLGWWLSTQRIAFKAGKMSPERAERLEAIGLVWTVIAGWGAQFELLQAFHAAHGTCLVPQTFVTADGINLGTWVNEQRQTYKKGKMSPARIERLGAIGFVWTVRAGGWDPHFELLRAYHAAHGNCVVPSNFVAADGTKLGSWVAAQRKARTAGKLSPERVERLEAVAFAWRELPNPTGWNARFEALQAYHAAHGNCVMPRNFVAADGTKLGAWVKTQEIAYKAGKLSPERFKRLEAIGFVWTGRADGWDPHFELLQAFHAAHGNCAVPQTFVAADGTKLGSWVAAQRQARTAGKLSAERVERLEAVEFVWRSPVGLADAWDAHFELLTAYHAAHGDCAVPKLFAAADGTKLGAWVTTQRTAYKAGKLSPERVERLGAVGFAWALHGDGWDTQFEALQAFHAAHGNYAVPQTFVAADGTKLGSWVAAQRHWHKAGKMSVERVERLEAVAFVWDPLADVWSADFELLQVYHAAHGNCVVPTEFVAANGTKLGAWVSKQRLAYNAGKLSPERVERLKAVAFV